MSCSIISMFLCITRNTRRAPLRMRRGSFSSSGSGICFWRSNWLASLSTYKLCNAKGWLKCKRRVVTVQQSACPGLYSTGRAVPFDCVKAVHVESQVAVWRTLHIVFGSCFTDGQSEYFKIYEILTSLLLKQLDHEAGPLQANNKNKAIDA